MHLFLHFMNDYLENTNGIIIPSPHTHLQTIGTYFPKKVITVTRLLLVHTVFV